MTNQEAINVLFNEWKCIDRNDGIHCDRKCESCDLVMDVGIIREAYNMAIEALKAQDDSLDEWCTDCKEYDQERHCCPRFNRVISETLKEVQSAKDINVRGKDTVYRQAAIDALGERPMVWTDDDQYALGERNQYDMNRLAIETLPSAQPERTCVNCGRTVNNGGWYADGGTRCPIEEHYALPKDGFCHLWEKRSVTDDDYPERREK